MRSGLLVSRFWEITAQMLIDRGIHSKTVSEREWLQGLEEDLKKRVEKHPLFSLSQLLLDGTVKGIGGPEPGSDEQLRTDNMEVVEVAVSADVKYLLDVGFLGALDEQSASTNAETFVRNAYYFRVCDEIATFHPR